MRFAPFTHLDISILDELRPPDWTDIKVPFQFYLSSHFCFPIKLTNEDKIIGVGCTIVHDDVAWLGHIIVHPEFRNQGHGTSITKHLIKIAEGHKTSTIFLIATDMGAPVYSKLGFETEIEYLFYKEVLLNENFVRSKNVIPFQEKYFDQLYQLDKKLSSENRLSHLMEHCSSGILYLENDRVLGFYLPNFGEGIILAEHQSAGIELLKLHLSNNDKIVFPIDNISALQFMKQNSLEPFRKAKRMRLGAKRDWNPSTIYNRIGGNLG
ncbi:MAG: GNAT family N-acetyltransferase [Bacteroidetes bacterium]|nr:GNAT family N-acetyltransferase [Bacteroidota bacterium]